TLLFPYTTLFRSHRPALSRVRRLLQRSQGSSGQIEQVTAQPWGTWGQEPCQRLPRTGRERPLLRNRGPQHRSHRQASAPHRKASGVIAHVSPGKVGRTTHHREICQREERTQPSETERHRVEDYWVRPLE